MPHRFRFVLVLSLAVSLLLSAAATAVAFPPEFGISQSYRNFGFNGDTNSYDPYEDVSRSIYWGPLNVKRLRVVVPWDIAERKPSDPRRAEFQHWLDRANELGADPFVVFGPTERTTSTDEVHSPPHYAALTTYDATNQHFIAPSGSIYKIAIQDFFATWGPKTSYDVEEIGAWNEPNRGSFPMAIPPQLTGQVYLPTNEYAMNDISHCPSGATNNNCGPLLAAWYWTHAVEAAIEVCGGSFCKIAAGEFASSAGTFPNDSAGAWQYWNTYGNKIKAINKYIPGVISFHAHRDAEELGNNIEYKKDANGNYVLDSNGNKIILANHDCKSGQTQWCVTTTFRSWMNSFGWSGLMDVWNTETGARYLRGEASSGVDTAQNNRFNWLIQISDEANVKRLYYFNFQGGATDRGLIDSSSGVDTRNRPIWNTIRCRNGCSTWTPPPAPTVLTTAASGVQTTQATLNATVNPNGANTSYRFEYGTADCASNPCTETPASDAYVGNGSSAVPESAVVSGLQPGTTYHYRVVATSSRGTSVSVDRTFQTLHGSSPSVIHEGANWWVYFQGSEGNLRDWFNNGSGWSEWNIGGQMAPGSDPSIVREGGNWWVFYRGTDGALWQWFYNGAWTNSRIGGQIKEGTSPVAHHEGANWWVYFQGSEGNLRDWFYNGSGWSEWNIGGQMRS